MRVLSLCPSITESLFALGLEPADANGPGIVARTKFCVEPAGAVEALPVVGGTKDPRLDRILALRPDLVLMNEEENRLEDAEALRAAGVRLETSLPVDAPTAAAALRAIGAAVGRASEGERLAAAIEAKLEQLSARASERAPTRFLYLIWRRPWMAAAPSTYIDALLGAAGGVNAVGADDPRYPEIALEDFRGHDVDRVLLSSEPYPFAEQHLDEVRALVGADGPSVELVDGRLLSWHGSSTLAGLEYAERLLVPRS